MFGYVTIYKPELKMKDYYKYKAYYCGLCRTLREKYGFTGQMTLTYDMTFAIILLASLYESESGKSTHRCVVHPLKKHEMLQNEITDYAASMNVLLAYYHFRDDWNDEKSVAGLMGTRLLKKKAEEIIQKYPRQSRTIRMCLHKLQCLEKENCTDIDRVAGCFGRLMGDLLVYKEDHWQGGLKKLGFYLGKFIYIMDAYDDLPKDQEKNAYNPLKERSRTETYEADIRQILIMMMGECSREFELLPCVEDTEILKNILYAGVWERYNKIQQDRKERKNDK